MDKDNRHTDNDEIDLIELVGIIWGRRFLIAGFVTFICILTIIYVIVADDIYEARAVLKPTEQNSSASSLGGLGALAGFAGVSIGSGGSIYSDLKFVINDKQFISEVVKKNNFRDKIVKDKKILESEKYMQNEESFLFAAVQRQINLSEDKASSYIIISFRNSDRVFSKEFLDALLEDVSSKLKEKQLENIDNRIENYKLEINRAPDITLKNMLSELVANQIQSKVLANVDKYYGFSVLSEPSVPEIMEKVAPKRALICIAAFFSSLAFAVFVVVLSDVFRKNLKNNEG